MQISAIIGHRGLASLAPENTLASIKLAHQYQINWVELDASILGDDTVILCHDDTLDRCSDGHGSLLATNRTDLSKLDAGSWFSETFTAEPIPTLVETLTLLSHLNMGLNLELKAQMGISALKTVSLIRPIIKQHWKSTQPLLISSFDHDILRLYRQLDQHQALGPLYEKIDPHWLNTMYELDAISLHCDWQQLTPQLADSIKAAGYQLITYTCNDQQSAERLWSMGVDSIISDKPHLLSAK